MKHLILGSGAILVGIILIMFVVMSIPAILEYVYPNKGGAIYRVMCYSGTRLIFDEKLVYKDYDGWYGKWYGYNYHRDRPMELPTSVPCTKLFIDSER